MGSDDDSWDREGFTSQLKYFADLYIRTSLAPFYLSIKRVTKK
jgi:hypothetical protein